MALPEGWTDDMSIPGLTDRALAELVELILRDGFNQVPASNTIDHLVTTFSLSTDNALLAYDRVHGGLVRAATGWPDNCPSQTKDPVAWASFCRCIREPSLITAIRPEWAGHLASKETPKPKKSPKQSWWQRIWRGWLG